MRFFPPGILNCCDFSRSFWLENDAFECTLEENIAGLSSYSARKLRNKYSGAVELLLG